MWFKIDDRFHSHEKAIAAGLDGVGLWALLGSWSSEHLTDGFVPRHVVENFAARGSGDALEKVLCAGLLEEVDDGERSGYQLHDFLDYNPSRKDAEKRRKQKSRAGKAGGKQKASNRLAAASGVLDGCQDSGHSSGVAEGYPVPVPKEHMSEKRVASSDGTAPAIAEVWEHWLRWWRRVRGRGSPPKLNDKVRGQLRARLREGYGAERLKRAADGCWTRKYNLENNYLTPDLVYRNGGQVEKYEAFAEPAPPAGDTLPRKTNAQVIEEAYAAVPGPAVVSLDEVRNG